MTTALKEESFDTTYTKTCSKRNQILQQEREGKCKAVNVVPVDGLGVDAVF